MDTGSRRILVIHPTGIIASELRFDDLGVIRAVVVDENGYLYAGGFNKNAKLMKYPELKQEYLNLSGSDIDKYLLIGGTIGERGC